MTDHWPTHAPAGTLTEADVFIEAYAEGYNAIIPGLGDAVRDAWQELKRWLLPPTCDCPLDPHHRWNCALTPIWAQTIRELDVNPWGRWSSHEVRRFINQKDSP